MKKEPKAPINDELKVTCDLSNKLWLNTEEACIYTTFGTDALREGRDMKKLAYLRKDRKILYYRPDLDEWVNTHEKHLVGGRVLNPNHKRP